MGWLSDAVSDVVDTASNIVSDAVSTASSAVGGVVDTIKNHPLEAAALAAGGYYFAPEIGAWLSADGGTVLAGDAAGSTGEVLVGDAASAAGYTGSGITAASPGAASYAGGLGSGIGSGVGTGAAGAGAGAGAATAGISNYLTPAAIFASSLLGANAAKKAAGTQAEAQSQANQLAYSMWQQQQMLQEPWRKAGINALNKLSSGNILGDDPGYAFRFSEGQKALERSAAAKGGLISGSALKATTRYGQDMGSQEYSNAFNRYASLAGLGQTATNNVSNAASNYGATVGNGITNAAAANAAGGVGAANALTSGLSQYLNYSSNQDLMNAVRQSSYAKA